MGLSHFLKNSLPDARILPRPPPCNSILIIQPTSELDLGGTELLHATVFF